MRIRILPSAPDAPPESQYLVSFVVDDVVAIDAGCLGLYQPPVDAPGPTEILLTHSHLDHVATLPLYLEDRHDRGNGPVRVHGPQTALDALRRHFFNPQVWMDEASLRDGQRPWVQLRPLEPERPLRVRGLTVTGVPVHHSVPTYGYVVDDGVSAVAFGADSGSTDRLWEVARGTGRLRAVLMECSFPDSYEGLARRTGHLTPRLWATELGKLPRDVRAVAVHIKPRFRDRVAEELRALGDPRVVIGAAGRDLVL